MAFDAKENDKMKKIYFQKDDGLLCERYPKDLQVTDDCIEIEVSDEEFEQTLQCEYGKVWAVKEGKLTIIDDDDIINSDEYKAYLKTTELASLKAYLTETDYVISKLNELKLEDEEEYEAEKAKYSDVLKRRKEARARINELSEGE